MGSRNSAPASATTRGSAGSRHYQSSFRRPEAPEVRRASSPTTTKVSSPRRKAAVRFGEKTVHELPARDKTTGRFLPRRASSPETAKRVRSQSPKGVVPSLSAFRSSSPVSSTRKPNSQQVEEVQKTPSIGVTRSRSRSPVVTKSNWTLDSDADDHEVSRREYASPSLVIQQSETPSSSKKLEPVISPATVRKSRKMSAEIQLPSSSSTTTATKSEDLLWKYLN